METATMGRVLVEAKIENLNDLWEVERGLRAADQVRTVTVPNALVDSGATTLSLPPSLIQTLGLKKVGQKHIRSATGTGVMGIYELAQLTIQERDARIDVMEVPEGSPVLIGQIPLEWMDWVIDMKGQRLIGNPDHGGEWVLEV